LIKINEHPKLKEAVLKEARMEKNKIKDRPKFIYYRLLRGIQNLFAGVKRLFSFRLEKKHKQRMKEQILKGLPLFKEIHLDQSWLLEIAV
jgi:hypothetical protein